jgi:hypothetical protein
MLRDTVRVILLRERVLLFFRLRERERERLRLLERKRVLEVMTTLVYLELLMNRVNKRRRERQVSRKG